jgi:hypothetical protein
VGVGSNPTQRKFENFRSVSVRVFAAAVSFFFENKSLLGIEPRIPWFEAKCLIHWATGTHTAQTSVTASVALKTHTHTHIKHKEKEKKRKEKKKKKKVNSISLLPHLPPPFLLFVFVLYVSSVSSVSESPSLRVSESL